MRKKNTSCERDRRSSDQLRDQNGEITRLKYNVELLCEIRGKKTKSVKTFLGGLSNKLVGVQIIIKKRIILQQCQERWDKIFQQQGLFVLFLPVIPF